MQTATIFNLETVPLDGEVFSGGKPPVFDNCRFDTCDWRFDDAAARTLAHLKVVWAAGGKAQVQALIKEITVSGGK